MGLQMICTIEIYIKPGFEKSGEEHEQTAIQICQDPGQGTGEEYHVREGCFQHVLAADPEGCHGGRRRGSVPGNRRLVRREPPMASAMQESGTRGLLIQNREHGGNDENDPAGAMAAGAI